MSRSHLERALEIKTIWRDTVLDTFTAIDDPVVLVDARWSATRVPDTGCTYTIAIDGDERELGDDETLRLKHGALTFQVRYVRRQRLPRPTFWRTLDYAWVNVLMLAIFAHAMAIISFVATPLARAGVTDAFWKNAGRFLQVELTPSSSRAAQSPAAAKAKGVEGRAGVERHVAKEPGRMALKGNTNDKDLARSMLTALFGAKGSEKRSTLFGTGGLAGELQEALGGVTGAHVGEATGALGLGARGAGPGGDGLSMRSVGIGRYYPLGASTRGHSNYGEGTATLTKKSDTTITIRNEPPTITGAIDKELIRRVIKDHLPQIRYCYERELIRTPGLFGKIATQFTINAEGKVQDVTVTHTTLANTEIERCVAAKMRTWIFPKPKGGGVVIVKYPFIFKTAG